MRRRGTAAGSTGALLVLCAAGFLLGPMVAPARAAEVAYATHCVPPAGIDPVDGTTKAEVTAPATAKVGDTVDVVWKFVQAASKNPDIIDLPANSVQPSGVLKAAGAQTADVSMRGPRENPAIPKGGDMVLSDMKGSLKLTAAGEVTLTPDAYTVNAMSTDTRCTPRGAVPKAATIKVTAGGGTSTPTATPTKPAPPTHSATATATATATGGTGQSDFPGKEVQVPYACKTPIGDRSATSPVRIDARKDGGSYALTVRFGKSVMDSPVDIPKDSVKPSMEVVLGGADHGTVHVAGPANAGPVKSGDPIEIPDLTGTYKPGASGTSTLSPGVLTVEALGTTTTCTPTKTAVSLTLDTTGQPGGAAGGTSTSTSGGSGSSGTATTGGDSGSGGLAETGAGDHGALKALGLISGTAILLGAAVFTVLPGRRTR
ncbi:hypothetical protein GCM10018980_38710 [Streptomyces capoamus]|uniref:Gram-positive cocci surface proteins LPxTG domain-containing protein n=1 Tax=Streptomyces capoamus TaxID=68183 RepID=A0A919C665_9ACTN|nr:hypothetical protein GCM10010501_27420 [Streptomyces libani subsp. rufus]GHG54266.1 hypothetical protein GCM10018980_38710 [Streptomyces capoamus]